MSAAPQSLTEFDVSLSLARQCLYRVSALALLDPRAGSWERLHDPTTQQLAIDAAMLVCGQPAAAVDTLSRGEQPLEKLDPSKLISLLPDHAAELNSVYERTFGLLVSGNCPPYETEYIDSKFTFQRSQNLGDISGFYAAFGLAPSSSNPERHDHIVLELEFMASLLYLERRAADESHPVDGDTVAICRDAQRKFFAGHLAWWIPTFARLLSQSNPGGYYEAVGTFLSALIPAERALLGIEAPTGVFGPSNVERPEECDGCLLAS
jgi:TorA maturation chaperone TorD